MSFLARPSVVFAIVFGCFAVLVPKVFLPLFRSKSASTSANFDDHLRRPPPPMIHNEQGDTVEHISGTPPHIRGAHPGMRMHHPGAQGRQQASSDQSSSKSIVTLALPMYTVGIGVFFIYTCCKYWSKKSKEENKSKSRCSRKTSPWASNKEKVNYDILDQDSEDEGNKEELYAGLDPDYVEYLKLKKQKALAAQLAMSDEQKQMHSALEEMKKSLSFISSKLVTKESRGNLDGDDINHLQDRLASTEAQMCKILTALDAASDKVNKLTKTSSKIPVNQEQHRRSSSDSDGEQLIRCNESIQDNSSEEDGPVRIDEDESESHDLIYTDDEYIPTAMDDIEFKTIPRGQRDCSSSCSSGDLSNEEDQSIPNDVENQLIQRKRQ